LAPSSALPRLGDPLAIEASPETLDLLARRRSSSAQTLAEPGPSDEELELLLRLGARVPDHGKLAPWRFVLFEPVAKAAYVARLEAIAAHDPLNGAQKLAKLGKLRAAPATITVISSPNPAAEIPEWEQILSSGAVCMTLLIAAQAMGYGANWITDWYAYDAQGREVLGLSAGEQVAGFIHIGTPPEPPLERVRPDVAALTRYWTG
jgi:nitroreductase